MKPKPEKTHVPDLVTKAARTIPQEILAVFGIRQSSAPLLGATMDEQVFPQSTEPSNDPVRERDHAREGPRGGAT